MIEIGACVPTARWSMRMQLPDTSDLTNARPFGGGLSDEEAGKGSMATIRAAARNALARARRWCELALDAKRDAMILLRRTKRRRAQESTSEAGGLGIFER